MLGQTPICKITQALHLFKNQESIISIIWNGRKLPLGVQQHPRSLPAEISAASASHTGLSHARRRTLHLSPSNISGLPPAHCPAPQSSWNGSPDLQCIRAPWYSVSYLRVQEAQPVCATSPVLGVKHMLFSSTCLAQLSFICDAACPAVKHLGFGGCTVKAIQCSGRVGTSEYDTQHPCSVLPRAAEAGDTGGCTPEDRSHGFCCRKDKAPRW